MRSRIRLVVVLFVLTAMLSLAAPAGATPIPGENGRIVLISGREAGDATSRGYLLPVKSNTIPLFADALSPAFTPPASGQFRHPTWSPDRTKIAYANGPAAGPYEIFVQDIAAGTSPVQISPTESPTNLSADRPAWSPDGTQLAYEQDPAAGDRQIRVQSTSDLTTPVTTTSTELTPAGAPTEAYPAWTPNSNEIYYATGAAGARDIVREPRAGGTPVPVITAGDAYQPSLSPDGTKLCYTDTAGGNVLVNTTPTPGVPVTIANAPAVSEYNCTWSPDGQMIAYVEGATTTGRLVMERADGTTVTPLELAQDPGNDNFDGNPDWARDGRPECPNQTVITPRNTPVTFTVTCPDSGPAYERTNVSEQNTTNPANGSIGDNHIAGEPFTYTPNQNFTGTDSFQVQGLDEFGFDDNTGTVTINVLAPATPGGGGGGGPINGTPGNDVINGTPGDDVINCGAGDDVVNGGGGNDIINCGAGRDRVNGGAGRDRISGSLGNDRINGGSGNDRVAGNRGNDRVGGGSGNDRVGGTSGNDRVNGESGNDIVNGDSGNDSAVGGSGNDKVNGSKGNDRVGGGRGNDLVVGGPGNDRVGGDAGRDRVSGGSGRDRLNGGRGSDRCGGDSGRDRAASCEVERRIP